MISFYSLFVIVLCTTASLHPASYASHEDELTSASEILAFLAKNHIAHGTKGVTLTSGHVPRISGCFKDTGEFRATDDEIPVYQPRTPEEIVAAFEAGRSIIRNNRENPNKYSSVGRTYLVTFYNKLSYSVILQDLTAEGQKDAQPTATTQTQLHAPKEARKASSASPASNTLREGMQKFCGLEK